MSEIGRITTTQSTSFTTTDDLSLTGKQRKDILGGENLTIDGKQSVDDSTTVGDGPEIPAAGTPDPKEAAEVDKQLGALLSKAGETFVGDTFSILVLFHKVAQSQRATARESREVARDAQYAAIDEQADKIRSAAWLSLAAGVVSGAASIASGMVSLKFAGDAARNLKASAAEGSTVLNKSDLILAKGKGYSEIAGGTGQIASSFFTLGSSYMQADQKEAEKEETQARAQVDNETEVVNLMLDVSRDVRQKMQEIASAHTDSLRSIMRA